jgi:hypothetical protein
LAADKHRPIAKVLGKCLLGLWVMVTLGACTLPSITGAQRPQPTLVPTLALVIGPTATPQPSATPEPDTVTPLPTDTPTQTNIPTHTVTAWLPDTATPGPSPTRTRTPTSTRIPTRTRIPSRTPTITYTPTITLTPTPPAPGLNLVRPGLMSKVLSPIQMEMYVTTGGDGTLQIELVGEDNRVISRQVLRTGNPGRHIWLAPNVPFEIDAAAETARLQVSTQDGYGRLEAVSSVDVILLSVGRNEINPPAIIQEPYLIRQPKPDGVVSGGLLIIEALARPVNDSPLIIELITESGSVLSEKQVNVPPPTGELSHTPFVVEIPYKVSEATPVRLIMRQEGSRIAGNVALVSELITLLP